ncbi:unnamed protein product, partial [Pleuronectes platessa]
WEKEPDRRRSLTVECGSIISERVPTHPTIPEFTQLPPILNTHLAPTHRPPSSLSALPPPGKQMEIRLLLLLLLPLSFSFHHLQVSCCGITGPPSSGGRRGYTVVLLVVVGCTPHSPSRPKPTIITRLGESISAEKQHIILASNQTTSSRPPPSRGSERRPTMTGENEARSPTAHIQ